MISIGGKDYKTLSDPIYLNNKRVKEVYVNDKKVYPEKDNDRITVVKYYIHIPINISYPLEEEEEYDDTEIKIIPPYDLIINGWITLVIIRKKIRDTFYIDNNYSGYNYMGTYNGAHIFTYDGYYNLEHFGSSIKNNGIFEPLFLRVSDLSNSPKNVKYNQYMDNFYKKLENKPVIGRVESSDIIKVGLQVNIDPIYLLPWQKNILYDNYDDMHVLQEYTIKPIYPFITEISEFNGKTFISDYVLKNDALFFVFDPYSIKPSAISNETSFYNVDYYPSIKVNIDYRNVNNRSDTVVVRFDFFRKNGLQMISDSGVIYNDLGFIFAATSLISNILYAGDDMNVDITEEDFKKALIIK